MKKYNTSGLSLVSVLIGFAATLMIVFPALVAGDSDTSYTGLQIAFGHEFVNLAGYASGQIVFSFMNVLAYLLPLVGAILLVFTKRGNLASAFVFGIAAILLFLVPQFTVVTVTALGNSIQVNVNWTYGIGLIIAASLSILGLLIGLYRISKKV